MSQRELSYKALLAMDGREVLVKDIENDIYDQICTVKILKEYVTTGKNPKMNEYINGIRLLNEEYIFEYDWKGQCKDGEFKCFSIQGRK